MYNLSYTMIYKLHRYLSKSPTTMNIFLDSNIFLQFYHYAKDDLTELNKLHGLIVEWKVKLIITEQIKNEVYRNRDNAVDAALKDFTKSKEEQSFPWISKTYPEYGEMKSLMKELKRSKSKLEEKICADINTMTLEADKLIVVLFKVALVLPIEGLLQKARDRYDFWNPPGKNNSYGDAINWESLLAHAPAEETFIISADSDYQSKLDAEKLNSFLLREWESKKGIPIFYYSSLSRFFPEHLKYIELKKLEELNGLILTLCQSRSFSRTHNTIELLSEYTHFTDIQVYQMIEASITNAQIRCIAQDEDVNTFFKKMLKGKEHLFPSELLQEFSNVFEIREESTVEIEEQPF